MTTFCPLHSSLPKEIYTSFLQKPLDQLCTSLMKRPITLFHSLPAFHFCLILGRGNSTPHSDQSIKKTQHIQTTAFYKQEGELDLQTARRERTDARQEGREKKEKEMTKGVQCSRRKTLKLFYLDRKWTSPQRLCSLIDFGLWLLLVLLFLTDDLAVFVCFGLLLLLFGVDLFNC